MAEKKKNHLLIGLLGGVVYALLMALFDYNDGLEFNFPKVLIGFLIFSILGFFISKASSYNSKKGS